ncbi:MAG TPA: redoxin domain-containing protein [Gemmatimonadales bacterium]|nr:redoxin domain-containing protein [Gemmatimonadales bacterium]
MHAYRDQYATLFKNGQNVVLIAISAEPVDTLAAWARDDQFQWVFAGDMGGVVGKLYGAYLGKYQLDNRNLFIVGPDGKIAYRQIPFREIDPTAYTELAHAVEHVVVTGTHAEGGGR